MSFRKRNKIKLTTSISNNKPNETKSYIIPKPSAINKTKNILQHYDLDEDNDEIDELNTSILNNNSIKIRRKISEPLVSSTSSTIIDTSKVTTNSDYDNILFKKNTQPKILNLEQLEEEEDDDDTNTNIVIQRKDKYIDTSKETDYAKHLNSDDKIEILENINKSGGIRKRNEKLEDWDAYDFDNFEQDDGKLALSKNEILKQDMARSEKIKNAILETENISSNDEELLEIDDWQNKIIKSTVNNIDDDLTNTSSSSLPILFKYDKENENEEISYEDLLSTLIRKNKLEHTKSHLQLSSLENQLSELNLKNSKIINSLADI